MSKYIPGNHKHLTASDRLYIERALNDCISFKEIARHLCKDPSTISKEVRAHRLSAMDVTRGMCAVPSLISITMMHSLQIADTGKLSAIPEPVSISPKRSSIALMLWLPL